MDLDQKLFKSIYDIIKKITRKPLDPKIERQTVKLINIQSNLIVLARLLTGKPIEIYVAEKEGGLFGNIFFLPQQFNHFEKIEDNANLYVFRIIYLSIQYSILFNATLDKEINIELIGKVKDPTNILSIMEKEYPNFINVYQHLLQCEMEYQNRMHPNASPNLAYLYGNIITKSTHKKVELNSVGKTHEQIKKQNKITEMQAPHKEKIETLEIEKKKLKDYTLIHTFEKIETIEEFNGNWRDFDSSDELEDHAEALQELDLRNTVRTDDPTHSVYQSEFINSGTLSESKEMTWDGEFFTYDEWNDKSKSYQKDYCKVYIKNQTEIDFAYYQSTMLKYKNIYIKLSNRFNKLNNSLESIKRMPYGEEPDLDVIVESFAEIKSGKTPTENTYIAKLKKRKDLSLLFLTDVSLSTDAYTAGKRILDVEKQSLIIFGEVLNQNNIRFQVDTFSSRTRNYCEYTTQKSFEDSWHKTKGKIGKYEPKGYTRIGPALRHATKLIAKEKSRKKWIVLLSDGKLNDYDKYEGNHGIHDVKQAIKEAKSKGVNIFTLAVESSAKFYLPLMMGKHFRILPNPEYLPEALGSFYEKIK